MPMCLARSFVMIVKRLIKMNFIKSLQRVCLSGVPYEGLWGGLCVAGPGAACWQWVSIIGL